MPSQTIIKTLENSPSQLLKGSLEEENGDFDTQEDTQRGFCGDLKEIIPVDCRHLATSNPTLLGCLPMHEKALTGGNNLMKLPFLK